MLDFCCLRCGHVPWAPCGGEHACGEAVAREAVARHPQVIAVPRHLVRWHACRSWVTGYDAIDSAWDSCEVGCAIPVLDNTLCGGDGLANYDWTRPYCDTGVLQQGQGGGGTSTGTAGGRACCAKAGCGTCKAGGSDGCVAASTNCIASNDALTHNNRVQWCDGAMHATFVRSLPSPHVPTLPTTPPPPPAVPPHRGSTCIRAAQRVGSTDTPHRASACVRAVKKKTGIEPAATQPVPAGGCALLCLQAILKKGRACVGATDVGCVVPKTGDGGKCGAASECTSGTCTGGRCCNAYGKDKGCAACDVSGKKRSISLLCQ